MKNKTTTAFLALTFGIFGLHRFYLGQKPIGIAYLALGFFGSIITIDSGDPVILLPIILATIDTILFFVMPQEEFDIKYNQAYNNNAYRRQRRPFFERKQRYYNKDYTSKNEAFRHFRRYRVDGYNYEGTIEDLQKDLGKDFDNAMTHFDLACCYSMLRKSHESFFHLEKAIELGFIDFNTIHNHEELAYVRSTPKFDHFVMNGYKNIAQLPTAQVNYLDPLPEPKKEESTQSILDQIIQLNELKEKGILTEKEFVLQKKRLLM